MAARRWPTGWRGIARFRSWPDDCPALLLIAPHPDDETLGFGATAAMLQSRGVNVQVVSVSDGGGAYPNLSPMERTWLEQTRRTELLRRDKPSRSEAPHLSGAARRKPV